MQFSTKTLLALLPYFLQANAGASGTGITTRYWDCCKPSCAWPGKFNLAAGSKPVQMCDIKDQPILDANAASGCAGGNAYQCSNESPWAVNDNLAYGYAAVNIAGGSEASWCCACYELTFTSGPVSGKKMIVQATNTGGDLAGNQFDISVRTPFPLQNPAMIFPNIPIQIPGGGVGIFNGCTNMFGAPSSGWGAQYGGIESRSACDSFPAALKDGCYWRYDWFKGANNPSVSFKQVACPAALTAKTGCARADDAGAPAADAPAADAPAPAASSPAPSPAASSPVVAASSPSPEPVVPSPAAQAQPTTSSTPTPTPVASTPSSTSTPDVSPGIFLQPEPSSSITTSAPSPVATYTAEPEIVTVTIEACEAQY
jgi:Glycosyl hydrolase family 45